MRARRADGSGALEWLDLSQLRDQPEFSVAGDDGAQLQRALRASLPAGIVWQYVVDAGGEMCSCACDSDIYFGLRCEKVRCA